VGQAASKLVVGDRVFAINGESVVGKTMREAAPIVMKSDEVSLTLDAPIAANTDDGAPPDSAVDVQASAGKHASDTTTTLDKNTTETKAARETELQAEKDAAASQKDAAEMKASVERRLADTAAAAEIQKIESLAAEAKKKADTSDTKATATTGPTSPRTVVLDRSDGKKIGIRLGSAAGADMPLTVKSVDPVGQAASKLVVGDRVFAINGESVVGKTMREAAPIVMKSDEVSLTLDAQLEVMCVPVDGSVVVRSKSEHENIDKPVTLVRGPNVALGVRLGNAPGPNKPLPVVSVDPGGLALGVVVPGARLVSINGGSVLGLSVKQAAVLVAKSNSSVLAFEKGSNVSGEASFDIVLTKPLGISVAGTSGSGIFVTKLRDNGSAGASGKISVGMQMIAINGSNLAGQGKELAISMMKDVVGSAKITFMRNQAGYEALQEGKREKKSGAGSVAASPPNVVESIYDNGEASPEAQ
jgi:predicted metalloprotease with PDZ domain